MKGYFVQAESKLTPDKLRRAQRVWHRGSTNAGTGAVATGSVTITMSLLLWTRSLQLPVLYCQAPRTSFHFTGWHHLLLPKIMDVTKRLD